jgi:hypothetical protein
MGQQLGGVAMKAKTLAESQMVNPEYSSAEHEAARMRGDVYAVAQFLTIPAGELVDDPECWRLCVGSSPHMTPADDECKAKVLAVMEDPQRVAFLQKIKRLGQPTVRKQLKKKGLEWLKAMEEAYKDELAAMEPADVKPKQKG